MATAIPRVDFTFDKPSIDNEHDAPDGYLLYRSPAGQNNYSNIKKVDESVVFDTVQISDTTVQWNTDYDYQITAFNSTGESSPVTLSNISIPEEIAKATSVTINFQ